MAQPTPLTVIDARRCTIKQLREQAGKAFLDGPRRYKVKDLEGPLLDLAVARAEGVPATIHLIDNPVGPFYECATLNSTGRLQRQYLPSRCWVDGGPIIEREKIDLMHVGGQSPIGPWWASMQALAIDNPDWDSIGGPTPLVAAMRAHVAVKLGAEIEL